MANTECDVDSILQVLDPEGTTTDNTGNRPLEDGVAPLVVGQSYVDVVFVETHPSYNFDQLEVQNSTDNPPLCLMVGPIVFQDEAGFRVMFNASPDSPFYSLRWRITI